jgi:Arc/MetJ family transcription regulator
MSAAHVARYSPPAARVQACHLACIAAKQPRLPYRSPSTQGYLFASVLPIDKPRCGSYPYTHMKTTVDIADALLAEAKRTANAEGTTLRALIEEALRRLLAERRSVMRHELRRASFRGEGLHPDVGSWEEMRRRAYEGRGG